MKSRASCRLIKNLSNKAAKSARSVNRSSWMQIKAALVYSIAWKVVRTAIFVNESDLRVKCFETGKRETIL